MKQKITYSRGVHPHDKKHLCENLAIQEMPLCSDYYLPVSQHIGAPATCIVNVGDDVSQGQLIGQATGKVSANIFSPVSGKVVEIVKLPTQNGGAANHIHIKAEGNRQVKLSPLANKDRESILTRIAEAGIIGLGGAGFPASVKDTPNKPVDTLLINAAECEPYLNCDNRLIIEYPEQVIEGIKLLACAVGVDKIVVGIEDNKPEAYEKLKNSGFYVQLLGKKYPQGAEKVLIDTVLDRKVPNKGGLPMEVGVVVHNVATAYAVYDAVVNGQPLYKRVVTVSGEGVNEPKNLWVLNGTSLQEIFDFCGGTNDKAVKLISGGPMMGLPLANTSYYTTKAQSGLLALTEKEINNLEPTACINCGRCASVCPMHLMPMYIDLYTIAGNTEKALKYGAMDCFECGCCSFVCPAKRWLVQSVRLTKKRVREAKK